MNQDRLNLLKKLIATPGPSGFERDVAAVFRDEAGTFADEVDRDLTGNSYAWVKGSDGGPVVMLAAHIDEIGVMVTHIDPEGFLWIDSIGGWDPQVLVGQRIVFAGKAGPVTGLVGRKAWHLVPAAERDVAMKMTDLWVDIGATSREDALAKVGIGDAGVADVPFVELAGDFVSSRAIDNRVSCLVALETARALAGTDCYASVVAVATAQEETSFGGAHTSSFQVSPTVAIAIDVTHTTDYPNMDKKRNDLVALGGGPAISRGPSVNPVVFERLVDAANASNTPYFVESAASKTWTDADAMVLSGRGPATGVVSIPTRYMHTPNEMISMKDVDAAVTLLVEFIRSIAPETDFRP